METYHPVLEELKSSGMLKAEQFEILQQKDPDRKQTMRDLLINSGYIDESTYLVAVARLLDTTVIDLMATPISPDIRSSFPPAIARAHQTVPVREQGNILLLATADLPDPAGTDEIRFMLSRPVHYLVAPQKQITETLEQYYRNDSDSIQEIFTAIEHNLIVSGTGLKRPEESIAVDELKQAAQATPIIRFVNIILCQAVKDRASDIHFEPFEHAFKIRSRVDGTLTELTPGSKQMALPVISRIKVMAGLNIAERRVPQDGRIQLNIAGRSVDFRVSTLPTQFGESVVLRVLDRTNVQLNIDRIGFPADVKKSFLRDIRKPNGLLVVTGPTGSGKTTTLYAALQQLNHPDTKILTAEDPVEYDVEGVIQLAVHDAIGLSFSAALRSFLRQDPDIIMVGEIRDLETAQIAIQASLTGHLVFSTLHTNDAAGAVTRLIDLGVEPFLITSTLDAVMGQRLVRTVCSNCKTPYLPAGRETALLGLNPSQFKNRRFYIGSGCSSCNETGYRGRSALFEYLRINDPLRTLIHERKPTRELRNCAVESGMRTLREDGILSLFNGKTTVEEIIQFT